jgi:hypothetical protein
MHYEKIIEEIKKKGFYCAGNIPSIIYNLFLNKISGIVHNNLIKSGVNIPGDFELIHYHKYCNDYLHRRMWNKKSRIFDEQFIRKYEITSWLNEICSIKPNYHVLDIEKIGYPEIYFRLVRPNKIEDISGPHTDGAYYEVTDKISEEKWKNWIKVWIPICHENRDNTLLLYPSSMNHSPKFIPKEFQDKPRPVLLENIENYYPCLNPNLDNGIALYFSPYLLHGALNSMNSKYTRVSIEFAIG